MQRLKTATTAAIVLWISFSTAVDAKDQSYFTRTKDSLREIAFPLGGIGAGNISIEGRGALRDWEIFNHPNKGCILPMTFPIIWCKAQGQPVQCRVIQGPRNKNFIGESPGGDSFFGYGFGKIQDQGDGLPCFSNVVFEGKFPVARLTFEQSEFPLDVNLTAFSPFIPLDTNSSSMPVACLVYQLKNRTSVPVEATVALNMHNATERAYNDQSGEKGKALTIFRQGEHCRGLWMTSQRWPQDNKNYGTMAMTTDWPDVTYLPQWQRGAWFDPTHHFWDQFSTTGMLDPNSASGEMGEPVNGTLGLRVKLAPGESARLPILISWCFPKHENGSINAYVKMWPTAWHAAEEFFKNRESLTARTHAFEKAFYESTLPPEVLDAAGSNASTLHSPTCLRFEDGTLWGWEGCSVKEGCCAGSCTHVYNYSLTPAFLFPELHRTMRKSEYNSFDSGDAGKKGAIVFRIPLPLGTEAKLYHAAVDGQLGGVVQLYRDWRFCGDDNYLKSMWPAAKRALEYAWVHWDADKDGLIEGEPQHNTYDINFKGPNPLSQFFYLGALKAGEKMAAYCGDANSAAEYKRLYVNGRKKTEKELYNGEYFEQQLDCLAPDTPKYQFGKGCLSDQLFGQLSAHVAGLDYLVEPEMVKSGLKSVYKYNFRDPLGDHANMQLIYAVGDESGLLLCSWPRGSRPLYPFVYSDQVWTGIEYHVASHLIYEGMVDEGLRIVRAVRKRYDGLRRNPYNEFECGSHYARAMSSWGLVLSLSGFRYDGVDKTLYLNPRWQEDKKMRCFFSTNTAWGVFEYKPEHLKLMPIEGELTVNRVVTDSGVFEVPAANQKTSPAKPIDLAISGH